MSPHVRNLEKPEFTFTKTDPDLEKILLNHKGSPTGLVKIRKPFYIDNELEYHIRYYEGNLIFEFNTTHRGSKIERYGIQDGFGRRVYIEEGDGLFLNPCHLFLSRTGISNIRREE